MIIIAFEKESTGNIGGLGDRVVGLIACKVIAKVLDKHFYILWTKENIKEYIDYQKYDIELTDISFNNATFYNSIDKINKYEKFLATSTELFKEPASKFYLNQEISQFIFKNPLFKNYNYNQIIMNEYKNLYSKTLKPTSYLLNIINNVIKDHINIVGIQIRIGDSVIKNKYNKLAGNYTSPDFKNPRNHKGSKIPLEDEITRIIQRIKGHISQKYKNIPNYKYKIFITSDYADIYNIACKTWNTQDLLYFDSDVQHIDKHPTQDGIIKVFVDNYILSQKTNLLYISANSNFGRIAALSSIHSNIYNIYTNILNPITLLSKH